MRVAMIEVGHWHADMHLRSLQLARAEIVGVSDHDPAVAARFAARLGCPSFADYRALLGATRPAFVLALGRHCDTPAIARDLLLAGLPFAIEKPIGTSAEQLAPLVELARERHAFAAVPLVNRYSEFWRTLDSLEAAGRVGARCHAHFRIVNGPPARYERDGVRWMLDPALSGGGALRNLGIHAADAFLQFARGEEVEVLASAASRRVFGLPIEEMSAALLRSKSGIIGTIEAAYTSASMTQGESEWRVGAANCYLVERSGRLQINTLDDGQAREVPAMDSAARYDRFGLDTLERLQAGRPPIATIEDCYRAALLLDKIYRQAVVTDSARRSDAKRAEGIPI